MLKLLKWTVVFATIMIAMDNTRADEIQSRPEIVPANYLTQLDSDSGSPTFLSL